MAQTFVGEVILTLSAAIAGGAGSSGGSLYIPVLILVFHKKSFVGYTKSLTTATVLTVSILNVIVEIYQRYQYQKNKQKKKRGRHKYKNPSISNNKNNKLNTGKNTGHENFIRYDVVSQMIPLSVLGASIGVRVNKILPFYVVAILLLILFVASGLKTWKKLKKLYNESERAQAIVRSVIQTFSTLSRRGRGSQTVNQLFLTVESNDVQINSNNSNNSNKSRLTTGTGSALIPIDERFETIDLNDENDKDNNSSSIAKKYKNETEKKQHKQKNQNKNKEKNKHRKKKYKGGKVENGQLNLNGELKPVAWKNIIFSIFIWASVLVLNAAMNGDLSMIFNVKCGSIEFWGIGIYLIVYLLLCYAVARKLTESRLSFGPGIAAFFGGLASGSLGTGASTIQMPFLLSSPAINNSKQASATSSFLTVLTESTAFILFLLLGDVSIDQAAIFAATAFIGALFGKFTVWQVTQNDARKWFVALLLVLYIGFSLVLILYISVKKIESDISSGNWSQNERFVGPCSTDSSNW